MGFDDFYHLPKKGDINKYIAQKIKKIKNK
jgi:hypothetical protein